MNFTLKDLEAQMTPEHHAAVVEAAAELTELITYLLKLGMVTTIETVPKTPLAMGNYELGINIRPGRKLTQMLTERAQAAADARIAELEAIELPLGVVLAGNGGDFGIEQHLELQKLRGL